MGTSKRDCELNLPKRTGRITSHHNISIASVSKWRKQHAASDLTTSAKDLYFLLQDMHQTPLSAKVRYEILALLQPNLGYLCDGLEKLYYRQEILSENQRSIADLVYALNDEMMNGYKIVISHCVNQFFVNKKLLLASLQQAMHYCIKILFHAFEQHRQPPQVSWSELHSLFNFATQRKLAQRSLSQTYSHSRFACLEDMYKYCLLFAIANPHRLRKEQIAHLTYAADSWAPLLVLKRADEKAEPALFMVDTLSNSGPKYSILYPEPSDHCYYLGLDKVNQRLMRLLAYTQPSPNSKNAVTFSASEIALPKAFVESVLTSWQQVGERMYVRENARGFVNVCLGLSASCHFVKKMDLNNGQSGEIFESDDVPVVEMIDIHTLPEDALTTESKSAEFTSYTCELIDQSERGYCLKWLTDVPPQLLCGEVIALEREMEHQKQWSIGTIRWLKHEEENTLLIGVQLLSFDAIAVKSHLLDANYGVPTLILPEHSSGTKKMTLITPPLPFKSGQEIVMEYQDQSYHANLISSNSLSPSYQEFELEFVDEPLVFPRTAPLPNDPVLASSISPHK